METEIRYIAPDNLQPDFPFVYLDWNVDSSQKPLLDLKKLHFFLEDRDYSKINLVDLKMSLDPLSTFRSTF